MSVLRDALRDLSGATFFDLLENEEAYLVVLDVPGADEDRVEHRVDDGQIVLEARREKSLPDDYQFVEENRTLFHDVELPLPSDAVAADATVAVDRGVLELRLPKRDEQTTIDVVEESPERESAGDGGDAGTDASS